MHNLLKRNQGGARSAIETVTCDKLKRSIKIVQMRTEPCTPRQRGEISQSIVVPVLIKRLDFVNDTHATVRSLEGDLDNKFIELILNE